MKIQSILIILILGLVPLPVSAEETVVCVAPFADNTGTKVEGVADGITNLISVTLGDQKGIRVVDRNKLSAVIKEQSMELKSLMETANAVKIGHLLGAGKIVTGGVIQNDSQITISAHVIDINSTAIIASQSKTGSLGDSLELVMGLVVELGKALNTDVAVVDEAEYDDNPMASLHMMRGLGYYHNGNYPQAIMEFMVTKDLDPVYPEIRYWIGQSYFKMKQYGHARIELNRFLYSNKDSVRAASVATMLKTCNEEYKERPLVLKKEKE